MSRKAQFCSICPGEDQGEYRGWCMFLVSRQMPSPGATPLPLQETEKYSYCFCDYCVSVCVWCYGAKKLSEAQQNTDWCPATKGYPCLYGRQGEWEETKHYGKRGKKKNSVAFSLNLLSPDQGNISTCQHLLSHLTRETSVLSTWQWQAKHRCLTISALSIHRFIHLHFSLFFYLAHVLQLPLCKDYRLPSFSPKNISGNEENNISIQKP